MTEMSFNANAPKLTEEQKFEVLCQWYEAKNALQAAQAKERLLRDQVFSEYFVDPKEGTNNFKLPTGDVLTAVYPMNRKIDKAVLNGLGEELRNMRVNVDEIVEYKPDLRIANYRKLTDEQRLVLDQCITMTPGSPQISIKVKS